MEQEAEGVPELAAIPAVGDRLIILATTLIADMNARCIEADLERIPNEIDRLYRAWKG